jgi:hypothetical protein
VREYSFKPFAVVADLDHQQPGGGQMLCRLAQDYAYCVKPVAASCECEPRLMEMFTRQLMHDAGADIGRIGDDQVITLAVQRRKQIRLSQAQAPLQMISRDVAPRHGQRRTRNIDGVNPCCRKRLGEHDGKAARAGAQIEGAFDARRPRDPRREALAQ